jgi:hypothetical protein
VEAEGVKGGEGEQGLKVSIRKRKAEQEFTEGRFSFRLRIQVTDS